MARYHGKNARVYMGDAAASVAIALTGVSSWDFDGSTDKVDVAGQGDTNKIKVLGLANADGSISFFWDDTDDTLFDAADSGEAVRIYLYRDQVQAVTVYRYGTAYVDITESADASDAVKGQATFSAAAAWGRKP